MPGATLTQPLPRGEEWELGYAVGHGPQMAPGEPAAMRDSFGDAGGAGLDSTLNAIA